MAVIALAPLGMAFTAIGGLAGFATGAIGLLGSSLAVLSGPAMLARGLSERGRSRIGTPARLKLIQFPRKALGGSLE